MGKKKVFSGTNYLGMKHHPLMVEKLREGINKYGVHYGGSRWSNICPAIYDQVESFLKKKYKVEDALLVSSGTVASSLISRLSGDFESIFYQVENVHATFDLPKKKSRPLKQIYRSSIRGKGSSLIIANSIDPTNLKVFDPELIPDELKNERSLLILDDSHGFGVLGNDGEGILNGAEISSSKMEVLISASLGKAFSIPGGVILGSRLYIQKIRESAAWGGASPSSPAYIHAFLELQPLYVEQLQKLRRNIELFMNKLDQKVKYIYKDNFPVFNFGTSSYYQNLEKQGYIISSFAYPDPLSTPVERVVINAEHSQNDILALTELINRN